MQQDRLKEWIRAVDAGATLARNEGEREPFMAARTALIKLYNIRERTMMTKLLARRACVHGPAKPLTNAA